MKHLKYINEFKKADDNLIDWLSMKFGKKIGNDLGSGMWGYVYEFGDNNVIKLSIKNEYESLSIIDKNIPGVAKIYSHGNIIVPKRFQSKNGGGSIEISKLRQQYMRPYKEDFDYTIYYIIMEKLMITTDLVNKIADIRYAIESYIDFLGFDYIGESDNPFRELFNNVNDDTFVQKMYNYITNGFEIDEELFAELVAIFRNVGNYYNWEDIHEGQFGRNSKGELVAFDFDNPHRKDINDFVKHTIRENFNNIKTINEYFQQADKLYFRDNKLTKEMEDFIVHLTNKDEYTKLLSDLLFHFIKFGSDFDDAYKSMLTNFYNDLKTYNKNVFPVPGKDLFKYGIDKPNGYHILDLYGIMCKRKNSLQYYENLPSVAKRNIRKEVRKERGEYEYSEIENNLRVLTRSLKSISFIPDEERKSSIFKKIFNSGNDLEKMTKYANKFAMSFNVNNEMFDKEDMLAQVKDLNADIIQNDDNVLVIKVNDQEAMAEIGCTSFWCFSRPGAYDDWETYAQNGYVYVIFNFNLDKENSEFLLTYLPDTYELFNSNNVNMSLPEYDDDEIDPYEYLKKIGVKIDRF